MTLQFYPKNIDDGIKALLMAMLLLFVVKSNAQVLSGGSGICIVTGNPNFVTDIATVDPQADCTTAYNEFTGDRWKYIPMRPEGDRWVMESNGIDTNVDSLDVNGGELRVREAGSFITLDVKEVAPIQTLGGGTPNVTVTESTAGSGDWIVNMTETPISVSQVGNDVTIDDGLGNTFTFSLNAAAPITLQSVGDIVLTEPTTGNYVMTFNETDINVDLSVAGQVSITNEAGVTKTFAVASTGVNSISSANDIEITQPTAGNYVVSFTESTSTMVLNGTDITYTDEEGTVTTFSIAGTGGGTGFTLHGSYKNDADAAANGCGINEYYELDVDNTLGGSVGDIRRRKN